MDRLVYLFPGQGSQFVGMGADLCAHSPAALKTFDEADTFFGMKLSTLCFYGPEETLRQTVYAQPALFVMSVAVLRALDECGVPAPQAVAGHSVGEYAALVAAGSVDFQTGLHLVERRAQEMHKSASLSKGTMAAVLGLSVDDVLTICREAEQQGHGIVEPANFNGGNQIVISGTPDGVSAASKIAISRGAKRVIGLNVSGAFHSRLMKPASEAMIRVLSEAKIGNAQIPTVSNLTADYQIEADDIRKNLADQIVNPVRWEESVQRLVDNQYNCFVEVGPGTILAGLMKRIAPGMRVRATGNFAEVQSIAATLS